MQPSVSILIPTHNRAAGLAQTLETVRAVRVPAGCAVELLVIANACIDNTGEIVERMAAGFSYPVRVIDEPAVGLSHARNRGIRESRSEILAFLDDDVGLDPGWLEGLLEGFAFPTQGKPVEIVAGAVTLWWRDVERPAWLETRSEHLLSCAHYGDQIIELKSPGLAIGANLAFRRSVMEDVGTFAPLGRSGKNIFGGEETEFLDRALKAGHRMFYAPRAALRHLVAPHRIEPAYLSKAAFANGVTRAFMRNPFTTSSALLLAMRYGFRYVSYLLIESVCYPVASKKIALHYRIRREESFGTVVGSWRRFHGSLPTGEKEGSAP
jgi:glycosyltransferase involved in cell wall biosynthesis